MRYLYHLPDWPAFRWREDEIATPLAAVRHRQGRLIGRMEGLGFDLRNEAVLTTLTDDVLKSSEIEGENLDKEQVRSSIARRLGMDISGLVPSDRNVEGVVEMMLDATQHFDQPLTEARLFDWHASLFPTGRSGMQRITVGAWRGAEGGPMQVVSGPIGRERVHYQAPDAEHLPEEMAAFLNWFEEPSAYDAVLKAALAHLRFVTIHPFDDGNGRIARAIADMALARSEGSVQRFYSMSAEIRKQRKGYYDILEATQKGDLDITAWLLWFLACLDGAIARSEDVLQHVFAKARFWEVHRDISFNDRQRLMLNKLLDGFEGKLNTSKWAKIAKCSQDTALRDIEALMVLGILEREPGGGRSTSYALSGGNYE
ncbi:Fic family protein [Novosphingobium naphthalenivorans]|uniref:Fic family protein n=1 Tax=Novosphingobium naphthalenivorans TaxID=273168 RepID=UPI00082F383E|nr:Fic family protein [Novosphingobium naphthalenivorans]